MQGDDLPALASFVPAEKPLGRRAGKPVPNECELTRMARKAWLVLQREGPASFIRGTIRTLFGTDR